MTGGLVRSGTTISTAHQMTRLATYYLAAVGLSLLLTPICRATAHRFGFVARPKEDRWHKRPTALFGGVAIAVTTLVLG